MVKRPAFDGPFLFGDRAHGALIRVDDRELGLVIRRRRKQLCHFYKIVARDGEHLNLKFKELTVVQT